MRVNGATAVSKKSMSDPQELELKLELTPVSADRLGKLALLRRKRCLCIRQESVYFDAPGYPLRAQGVSVRVRRCGETFTQTVKRGTAAAGLFQRDEWEQRVDGFEPALRDFDPKPLRKIRHLSGELEPVARVEVDRSILSLIHIPSPRDS